jgi:hypothetical protein
MISASAISFSGSSNRNIAAPFLMRARWRACRIRLAHRAGDAGTFCSAVFRGLKTARFSALDFSSSLKSHFVSANIVA